MTHINKFPPEILSHIFSILFDLTDEELMPTRRRSYELLDCLLVCRRWTQVAGATPSLWTTIHVTHRSGAVQRARSYLERSGGLSLDVVVAPEPQKLQILEAEEALQVLSDYPTRWNTFSTSFNTPRMNEILGVTLPNLISFSDFYPCPQPDSTPLITLDTPKLESCTAHADTVFFKNDSWPALKYLDIQSLSGFETWVWRMLAASQSSLESLVFRSDERIWIDNRPFEEVHGQGTAVSSLTGLKRLEVHSLSDGWWSTLRFAAMPALTHLTLHLDFFPVVQEIRHTLPAFHSLQSLRVHTYSSPNVGDSISLFLTLAPNLTSLIVTDKSGRFAEREGHMIMPLLLTSTASPNEPLAGRNLREVRLLKVPTSVQTLKELVDLRAGCLKKIVLTKGWDIIQEPRGLTTKQDLDDVLLVWLKTMVVLEEIDGEWD
ncbi:hypothetical protein M407DRAFT_26554 [Tulasnella calospora MUT 4182]|uniref:F-box domain-containing protein n=1 Tax=Tulasnella calospora MUT 4182 TaxID=1051891 RepID=A0A0C3Q4R6_9AGAM|nr:hypothetical protein M407DRAFT_26554 [Tulasnella calospora MUT 4182]